MAAILFQDHPYVWRTTVCHEVHRLPVHFLSFLGPLTLLCDILMAYVGYGTIHNIHLSQLLALCKLWAPPGLMLPGQESFTVP